MALCGWLWIHNNNSPFAMGGIMGCMFTVLPSGGKWIKRVIIKVAHPCSSIIDSTPRSHCVTCFCNSDKRKQIWMIVDIIWRKSMQMNEKRFDTSLLNESRTRVWRRLFRVLSSAAAYLMLCIPKYHGKVGGGWLYSPAVH